MSLVEKRMLHGEPFYELKDVDMNEFSNRAELLCNEGYCDHRHDCDYQESPRNKMGNSGMYTPILGCRHYEHSTGEFLIDFDAKFNDDSFDMDNNN